MRPTDQSHEQNPTAAKSAEFGRYVIAGLINTFVSFLVYAAIITYTPAEYWLANLFATLAGILCGFVLARIFVFKGSETSIIQSGPRYLITIALQYIVSTAAIGVLVRFGISEITAYVLVLPIAVGLSFILQKHWVFPNALNSTR